MAYPARMLPLARAAVLAARAPSPVLPPAGFEQRKETPLGVEKIGPVERIGPIYIFFRVFSHTVRHMKAQK